MKFGGIEFGGKLGGYELINQSTEKLPQDLASAVGKVFGENGMLGATYDPIWYLGTQIVNGTNHLLICLQTRLTKENDKKIVGVVINIPAGSIGGNDAKIVEVIEDSDLIEGTNLELGIREKFERAMNGLVGVSYKPVMYVGSQVVKGMNYYIVAEARLIYPNSEPYAAMICINEFQGNVGLVGIETLK